MFHSQPHRVSIYIPFATSSRLDLVSFRTLIAFAFILQSQPHRTSIVMAYFCFGNFFIGHALILMDTLIHEVFKYVQSAQLGHPVNDKRW